MIIRDQTWGASIPEVGPVRESSLRFLNPKQKLKTARWWQVSHRLSKLILLKVLLWTGECWQLSFSPVLCVSSPMKWGA